MKWKPLFAALIGLLMLGVTAGSASATVWGTPAGSRTGATEDGIQPRLTFGVSYRGVEVSFSVSWNDHHGAAWGVWQWANYDDSINKYIGFYAGSTYQTKGYSTPIIGYTKIDYSVSLDVGEPFAYRSKDGMLYYIKTYYHVIVYKKTDKWFWDHPKIEKIVDFGECVSYFIPSPEYIV
ncbi:hypothetical protein [Thermococcus waiotapuensis]|uniref:Uncharacterized protein n=1 Tax=Thermococcus waiotapuensis TaxID=90909 RepID=A0AAE4NV39_9EURY|nr:hypothetical protein [Thermococcus waiotapuensis]MDV3103186.1 hypothetical protein [Thermococcus waiotapuensis]